MHTPPTDKHNGITIVIDKPSRFDIKQGYLLSGQPRQWMDDEILSPSYRLVDCDIRSSDESTSFLPTTRKLFLLGRHAASKFSLDIDRHGYPAKVIGIPTTVAFYPQDCCDHRNIEYSGESDDEDNIISDRDIKDTAPTKRSNHRFWTMWHLRRALYGLSPSTAPKPIAIRTYPNLDQAYKIFQSITNENLYLDIETSRIHRCLTCVGLSSDSLWPIVYVFPFYLPSGELAYTNWQLLYKLLYTCIKSNQVVAHNSSFDLFILRAFYKLPFPENVYDTLLANHRAFPEIEKSLAHVISMWLRQPYHKDVATEVYNQAGLNKMWAYNAWDVYSLKLIKDAQTAYASGIVGLPDSIQQANSMVIPYLNNSLQGLPINLFTLAKTHRQLSIAQTAYTNICGMLAGISTFNPGSAQQCKKFFHEKLNYPVVARSAKPPYNPKLGRKEMYQLLLKTNNPLIKAILRYRKVAKDASMLESELWIPQ